LGKPLAVLCVHGIGHQEADPEFPAGWTRAIVSAVQSWDATLQPKIDFVQYDDVFDHAPLNPTTYAIAFAKLLASGTIHEIGDVLDHARGLGGIPEALKWTAGMVAQWSTEDDLRARTREVILAQLRKNSYDVVCAHSLGSLICYDTFARNPNALSDTVFVSLGSQIGNPAVRDVFAGRITTLAAREWYHLFNPDDHVLTCPLRVSAANFQQVTTEFDIPNDLLNHNATWYLGHANTVATVWRDLVAGPQPRSLTNVERGFAKAVARPSRRALLIGINDYPNPANRLEGCVNDVFLISSVLQECAFEPEEIRVVLDDRATTDGIMDRLHWLLDDVHDGDERILFYSGHGAQIPEYGPAQEPDHFDECLVPYDFDWTAAHAIRDKQFCELYSQLPYASRFVAVFDCCHSGGITRDGGPRIRGLTPPDDIRHRALRWNAREQMWVTRDFPAVNRSLADSKDGKKYIGTDGAVLRMGRAGNLRTLSSGKYDATRKALGHKGPYLPILLEACKEQEYSYEYRHGVISYGAFTFCLAQALREERENGTNPSFEQLAALATAKLKRLKYNQSPVLVGARISIRQALTWSSEARRALPSPARVARRPAAKHARRKPARRK